MAITRTLKDWSALGYRVKKGSHCVGRNGAGVPIFDHSQVERPPWHNGQRQYERNYHSGGYENVERYGDYKEVMEPPAHYRGRGYASDDCNCGVGWGCGCGTRRRPVGPFHSYPDDDDGGEEKWDGYFS